LATRLQERAAPGRIGRPFLAERLNRALDSGSILLAAGAGCGKTIALEEALARRAARSVWVRCGPADEDPGRLLQRIVDLLGEAAPGAADPMAERLAAARELIDARAMSHELVNELDRLLVDQVVIVVDDAEHLSAAPDAAALVGDLLAARSGVLRTAVATRRPLPLRLGKLRSSGRLTEFGAGDLAFSPDECGELIRSVRGAPVDGAAERLFAATEGWPLGASLGAVHSDVPSLRGTASRNRLFEFLREEVLERLPAALRGPVIDSSLPRELDGGCMRALGLSEDVAERVAQVGLPLRPVDAEHTWFAYHPLVREFLIERLTAERDPGTLRKLHARVAPALAESGRVEEAIEHWLSAEAWDEAQEAIAAAGPSLLHSAPAMVQGWLDSLPPGNRVTPSLLLLQGALHWAAGRQAEAVDRLRDSVAAFTRAGDVPGMWLARFALADPLWVTGAPEEVVTLAADFDGEAAMAAGIAAPAVGGYAAAALGALGRVQECRQLSQRLVAHPHAGAVLPPRVVWELYLHLLAGDFGELVRGAQAAIRQLERFDPFNRLPVVAAILPLALGDQGHDAEALAGWQRVEELARSAHSGAMLKVSLVWQALLHVRAGRAGPAQDCLARANERTGIGWREYAAELARARVAAVDGDADEAVAAAERALALAEQAPLSERFQTIVEATPVLFDAGLSTRCRSLVERAHSLCDQRVPGAPGRYSRSLLLGLRAWLGDAEGDEAAAMSDLTRMWDGAGAVAPDVVRREWVLLEPLLWKALQSGALDPDSVIGAVEAAFPGGAVVLPFTAHPDARVRRAAVAPAGISGHPDLIPKLSALEDDPDPEVAAAAAAAHRRLRASPPPLVFTLLGGFEVRRGSWRADSAAWDRRVAQRLVRYLLVKRGTAVPDDLLLEAFWSGKPQESARRGLKVAVSCARAVVDVPGAPSVIEVAERTLALKLRPGDAIDVDRFEAAATAALGAAVEDRRPLLERAAGLWTGEPLPEERYSDWTAAWRDSLTVRYSEVLTGLVAACHEEGDHPAATQAARRLVALDPLDESAQRRLIVAYARAGRRAHALRQYLECRRRLVDELGIEPAHETTEVQRRVLAGEPV